MPAADSNALFFAPNSQDWMALYRDGALQLATPSSETSPGYAILEVLHERLLSTPFDCHFAVYSAIENVLSAILEARMIEILTDKYIHKLYLSLTAFRR